MPPSLSHTATTPATAALVVAVVGSYRKGGVTDRLVDEMLAEVVAQGHAGQKVYLSEVPIEFCRNCRRCTQTPGMERGVCDLQDGLPALLKVLERADGLILASPVNSFTTTALTKRFVERLICGTYWPWGQRAPKLRCNNPRQRALLVSSCAMPAVLARRVTNVLRVLKSAAAVLGARPVGSLVVGLVAQSEHPTLSERSRRRARKLTRKLLKGLPLE